MRKLIVSLELKDDAFYITSTCAECGVVSLPIIVYSTNAADLKDDLTEDVLPGVEFSVTLAAPPSQRIQVRGVVARVTRARAEFALSEAELEGLGWIEGEDDIMLLCEECKKN